MSQLNTTVVVVHYTTESYAFDAAQQQKDRAINQLKSKSAMGSGYVDWQYEAGGAWSNMASDTAKEKDDP